MSAYFTKNKVIIINWERFRKNTLNNIIIPLSKYLSYILVAIILVVILFFIGRLFLPVKIGADNKVEQYSIINIIIFIISNGISLIILSVATAVFLFIIKWIYLHIFTADYMSTFSSINIYDKNEYQDLLDKYNNGNFKEID
jgi:hypothetical protein